MRHVATHPDARAAPSAPRVLVPACERQHHVALPLELGSVAPLLPPALPPSFGIAPSPVANSRPKRHHQPGDRRLGRRIQSTHPLQRMGPNGAAAVAASAREANRAIICRSRDAQVCALAEPERASRLNYTARSRRQGRTPPPPRVSTLTALASPGGTALRKARLESACLVSESSPAHK